VIPSPVRLRDGLHNCSADGSDTSPSLRATRWRTRSARAVLTAHHLHAASESCNTTRRISPRFSPGGVPVGCFPNGRGLSAARRAALKNVISMLATASALGHGGVARASSCPMSTQVDPFKPTTLSRYKVAVEDGGPGDLDGVVDGSCEFAVSLCVDGAPSTEECGDEHASRVRVSASGRASWRKKARKRIADAIENLAALAANPGAPVDGSETCSATTVRVPAGASAHSKLGLRFHISGTTPTSKRFNGHSRLELRCRK